MTTSALSGVDCLDPDFEARQPSVGKPGSNRSSTASPQRRNHASSEKDTSDDRSRIGHAAGCFNGGVGNTNRYGALAIKGKSSLMDAPTTPPPGTLGTQSATNRIVQGLGDPHDDLNDESTLCNGCSFASGNYAGFWQAILWAEEFLTTSQVDSEFGPITARATANWQRSMGLAADGVVGKDTRSVAQNFLYESDAPTCNLLYVANKERLYLFRDSNANYWIWWNNSWSMLRYTDKTIVGC